MTQENMSCACCALTSVSHVRNSIKADTLLSKESDCKACTGFVTNGNSIGNYDNELFGWCSCGRNLPTIAMRRQCKRKSPKKPEPKSSFSNKETNSDGLFGYRPEPSHTNGIRDYAFKHYRDSSNYMSEYRKGYSFTMTMNPTAHTLVTAEEMIESQTAASPPPPPEHTAPIKTNHTTGSHPGIVERCLKLASKSATLELYKKYHQEGDQQESASPHKDSESDSNSSDKEKDKVTKDPGKRDRHLAVVARSDRMSDEQNEDNSPVTPPCSDFPKVFDTEVKQVHRTKYDGTPVQKLMAYLEKKGAIVPEAHKVLIADKYEKLRALRQEQALAGPGGLERVRSIVEGRNGTTDLEPSCVRCGVKQAEDKESKLPRNRALADPRRRGLTARHWEFEERDLKNLDGKVKPCDQAIQCHFADVIMDTFPSLRREIEGQTQGQNQGQGQLDTRRAYESVQDSYVGKNAVPLPSLPLESRPVEFICEDSKTEYHNDSAKGQTIRNQSKTFTNTTSKMNLGNLPSSGQINGRGGPVAHSAPSGGAGSSVGGAGSGTVSLPPLAVFYSSDDLPRSRRARCPSRTVQSEPLVLPSLAKWLSDSAIHTHALQRHKDVTDSKEQHRRRQRRTKPALVEMPGSTPTELAAREMQILRMYKELRKRKPAHMSDSDTMRSRHAQSLEVTVKPGKRQGVK